MNKPPSSEVFDRLLQSDVVMVSFYRYEGHLTFENNNSLSFSAPFRFAPSEHIGAAPLQEFPLQETRLVGLLGSCITKLNIEEDGTLELCFSNGCTFIVYANNPWYEAYSLFVDGKEHIV